MIFYPEERLAIFIDGANLYSAARGLAFDIDYKRLLDLFSARGRLIRAFYYTALLEDQDTLFQVRAREHTTALQLDGSTLKAYCLNDPTLGSELFHRILRVVAGRVKATETRFAEMCGIKV